MPKVNKKHVDIQTQVEIAFNDYYENKDHLDAAYAFNGQDALDPTRFAQLVHLRTGFKVTTIDRYRRALEAKRIGKVA